MIYVAYTFAFLFVVVVIRTALSGRLKKLWNDKKHELLIKINEEDSLKKGYKPYYFDKGSTVVWASSAKSAASQFLAFKRKSISDGIVRKHKK